MNTSKREFIKRLGLAGAAGVAAAAIAPSKTMAEIEAVEDDGRDRG